MSCMLVRDFELKSSFFRCAFHPGAFGKGQTKDISCTTQRTGRYVFIILRATEYLTLCEVEVFAVRGGRLQLILHLLHLNKTFVLCSYCKLRRSYRGCKLLNREIYAKTSCRKFQVLELMEISYKLRMIKNILGTKIVGP